jgi:hypothetical protein
MTTISDPSTSGTTADRTPAHSTPTDTSRPIALLPLDERPVNTQLPGDVAAIAGITLELPPVWTLPEQRKPGDTDALMLWAESSLLSLNAADLVVGLDTLLYGGLIASRISDTTAIDAHKRLDRLEELRDRFPHVAFDAVGLVTRASDSYAALEDPEYWPRFGRDIHAFGVRAHLDAMTAVPEDVIADFSRRRLRNHQVNLRCLDLAQVGTFTTLALTADDTAEHSVGSAEQTWLRHWMRMLPAGRRVHMYPGADEVGAVLVARAILRRHQAEPAIRVVSADPTSLDRIPPYENQPVSESILQQLSVVGAETAGSPDTADAILVVHGPAPEPRDHVPGAMVRPEAADHDTSAAAAATGTLVLSLLDAGHRVGLADVRYANGADPQLTTWLAEHDALLRLEAYSGWNTAGNSLGSAIALLATATVARESGTLDDDARRLALVRRLLDDHAYQAVVRPRLFQELFGGSHEPVGADRVSRAARIIADELRGTLAEWGVTDLQLTEVALPWNRSFEVRIDLVHDPDESVEGDTAEARSGAGDSGA